MEKKEKKINKPKSSLSIANKPQMTLGQFEVGFDNDDDKAKSLELTNKAKQGMLRKFHKYNPPLTHNPSFIENSLNNYIKNEIYISLTVKDIYKIINKQGLINYRKVILINGYCIITSLILQVLFLIIIAYLRPALMTNKYSCFDQHTMNYIQCHDRNMCSCENTQGCVSFCYNESYTNCTEQFKSQNISPMNSFISHYGQMRFVKYSISQYENKSLFQKINQSYCDSKLYIAILMFLFVLGGIIGYCLFGPIADVNGKKTAIAIQLIGLIIAIIPIIIINYFDMSDNTTSFIIHWAFIYFSLGMFLLPLDSCLLIYVLENCPLSEELKSLNVNFIRREAISFFLFYLYDYFIQNIGFALCFIEFYLIVFALVFALYYMDTPRLYSERINKYHLKAKAIRFFTKPWDVLYSIANKTQKRFEGFKRIALISKINPIEANTITQNASHSNNAHCNAKAKDKSPSLNEISNGNSNSNGHYNSNRELNTSFKTYEIIKRKYYSNKHIEKYYYLMLFCLLGISICYYSIIVSLMKNLMDPNILIEELQKVYLCIYIFCFIIILIPLLNKVIMECFSFEGLIPFLFVLFTIVTCVFEIPELRNDSERINYYGNDIDKLLRLKNLYVQGTAFWLITWIYHLYEFLLLRQAPTLYRTIFFFNQKSVCHLTILFSVVYVFLIDAPVSMVGILGFVVTLLLFVVRINWKYEMFEENKDIEEKQKMNNKNVNL